MEIEAVKAAPADASAAETARLRALFSELQKGGHQAQKALGTIYELTVRRLHAVLRVRRFSPDEARDIVQIAFLRLVERVETLTDVENPRAFLYRVVLNCATDSLRSRQRQGKNVDVEEADDAELVAEDGLDDCLERAFTHFEEATPDRALAVRLAVLEGFSGEELAEALDRTYGATREFLSQARKQFQQLLLSLCSDYVPAEWRATA